MKPIPFHLATGCRVTLNGIPFTIGVVTHDGAQLERKDTRQKIIHTRYELAYWASEGNLVFLDGLAAQPSQLETRPVPWHRLNANQRARIAFRMSYVKALEKLDVRSPNNPVFRKAVEDVARRRGDNPAPSEFTVYRWVRHYRASGRDTDALAREFATKKGRSSRIPPEVRELMVQKFMERASNPGATFSGFFEEVMKEIAEELGYSGYGKPPHGKSGAEQ
jgi:hypothetical protein